ncbi:MAG: multicopper oxidase family protein, partial [Verrucomicrobiota bacterium]
GLAGFCLFTDPFEEKLMADNVLPKVDGPDGEQGAYDVPLALTDQRLNADGTIFWDPLDHDGRLGNLHCVNGVVQPFLEVERRKYRFRILAASLARIYELRLSNNQSMLQIGNDSWLLPKGVTVSRITLVPGKRADVIIDFSQLANGTVVYLENIMIQEDGRKPKGIDTTSPTRLIKFIVRGTRAVANDITITATTPLRPHRPIPQAELAGTREFKLGRTNGAWVINDVFYSAFRCDANPAVNSAERWILSNGSGGWVHPLHIHLESHQILTLNGSRPREVWAYKTDTTYLDENTEAVVAMRFRTFQGPFVFHCHNNNHEDMRMMQQMETCPVDPVTGVKAAPQLNGEWFSVDPAIAGIPVDVIKANPILFS